MLTPASLEELKRSRKKPHKYHVADPEKRTFMGVVYHSAAEASYARTLELARMSGELRSVERQHRLPIRINGSRLMTVVIDFKVIDRNSAERWIEVKGKETDRWRLNLRALRICYPEVFAKLEVIRG